MISRHFFSCGHLNFFLILFGGGGWGGGSFVLVLLLLLFCFVLGLYLAPIILGMQCKMDGEKKKEETFIAQFAFTTGQHTTEYAVNEV